MSEQVAEQVAEPVQPTVMETPAEEIAASNKDYTFFVQAKLEKVMENCATDTEFPLAEKDFDHGSFPWFANCVKNNVFMSTTLNQNKTVRTQVAGTEW